MFVVGYGHSREVNLGGASRGDFLAAVVETLDIKPVIVSPSMSGGFALPYLFQDPAKSLERAIGYIPIAPVMTGEFKTNYPRSQVGTIMQIYLSFTPVVSEWEKCGM